MRDKQRTNKQTNIEDRATQPKWKLEAEFRNNQMGALTVLQRICKIGNRHLNILECSKKIIE